MFNLPGKINDSDIFISKLFCIFEIENIFDLEFYDNLKLEFPVDESLFKTFDIGKKNFLNNENKKFYKFIKRNINYLKLYNYFNNPKTFKKIFNLLKSEIIKIEERKKINNVFLVSTNNKFIIKTLKFFFGLFNIKIVKLGFEFSIIKNDCYIPLHTDKMNKLISLMIYIPENNNTENEINWGTCFYKIKNNNQNIKLWDSTFMNEEDSQKYHRYIEKFYQSPFTKNKLVGFLKSNNSFHKIEKIKQKDAIRKSININYYIQ